MSKRAAAGRRVGFLEAGGRVGGGGCPSSGEKAGGWIRVGGWSLSGGEGRGEKEEEG